MQDSQSRSAGPAARARRATLAGVRRAILLLVAVFAVGAASAQGATPLVSVFFYPWYGTPAHDGAYVHWNQNGRRPPVDIASDFFPQRGPYSSSEPRVLQAQLQEIAAAGIDELAVSWWGRDSAEDRRLPTVVAAARRQRLAVAVHLEPYLGRTAESTEADIRYLQMLGAQTFYVYASTLVPDADWAAVNDRLEGVRVLAGTPSVGRALAGGFDGVYTYDVLLYGASAFARICQAARRKGLLCAPSVGPGYSAARATGDIRAKPRRDGATYDAMWRAALAAHADLVTITSYNEWHEGTQIEPALDRGAGRYRSYAGAYGRRGVAARRAYLDRTAYWARELRKGRREPAVAAATRQRGSMLLGPLAGPLDRFLGGAALLAGALGWPTDGARGTRV